MPDAKYGEELCAWVRLRQVPSACSLPPAAAHCLLPAAACCVMPRVPPACSLLPAPHCLLPPACTLSPAACCRRFLHAELTLQADPPYPPFPCSGWRREGQRHVAGKELQAWCKGKIAHYKVPRHWKVS